MDYKLYVLVNSEVYYESRYTVLATAKKALTDMIDSINEIAHTINGNVVILLMENNSVVARYYLKHEVANANNP